MISKQLPSLFIAALCATASATTYTVQDLTPAEGNFSASAAANGVIAAQWYDLDGTIFAQWYDRGFVIFPGGGTAYLNNGDFDGARVEGTDGKTFVGTGYSKDERETQHAVVWRTYDAKPIKLTPAGFQHSWARGYALGITVGSGLKNGVDRALVWTAKSPSSAKDVTPAGYSSSVANAIAGQRIVGSAYVGNASHAMAWTEAGASFRDLHRLDWYSSEALGASATEVVGCFSRTSTDMKKAVRWTDAGRIVNMHPMGYQSSAAVASRGGRQGGYAVLQGYSQPRAIVWERNVAQDLHSTLPSNFLLSQIVSIDRDGSLVGSAMDNLGQWHVIRWAPVVS